MAHEALQIERVDCGRRHERVPAERDPKEVGVRGRIPVIQHASLEAPRGGARRVWRRCTRGEQGGTGRRSTERDPPGWLCPHARTFKEWNVLMLRTEP